jgi:hypothetical protein
MYPCHPPHDDGHPFVPNPGGGVLPQVGSAAALILAGAGAFVLGLENVAEPGVVSAALFASASGIGLLSWAVGDRC